MPKIEYFTPVNADLQTIWSVLLDRIEHPERYQEKLESCTFPENTETYAIREIVIQGERIRERITIDERQGSIRYELVNNPFFSGDVCHELIPPDENDPKALPVVRFRMDWKPRNPVAGAMEARAGEALRQSLEMAVQNVRILAEHIAKESPK